jgi:hypothetical protein
MICVYFSLGGALTLLMPGTRWPLELNPWFLDPMPGRGSLISFTKTYSAEEAVRRRGEAVLDGDSIRK